MKKNEDKINNEEDNKKKKYKTTNKKIKSQTPKKPYPARKNKCTFNVFNMHNNLNKSCFSIFTNTLVSRSSFAPSTSSYVQSLASRSQARKSLNSVRPTGSRSSLIKEKKRVQKLSISTPMAQKGRIHGAYLKIHPNGPMKMLV